MSKMEFGHMESFEHMMHEIPKSTQGRGDEDGFCFRCPYHRAKWKYRYCFFINCPYIKGMQTFREEVYEIGD